MDDQPAAMEAAAMEAAAQALFDVDPMFVGGNDWLTWDMLTDEGKARFRRRAQVAIGTYLQSTRATPQDALDLSRALDLLVGAIQGKDGWRERTLDFVEEMIPGERAHLQQGAGDD